LRRKDRKKVDEQAVHYEERWSDKDRKNEQK